MYSNTQFNRWADNLSGATHKAFDQGKNIFYMTRKKAKAAKRSLPVRRVMSSLPMIQSHYYIAKKKAEKKADIFRKNFNDKLYTTESTIIKLTGLYLLVKWFQNRDKDVFEKTNSVKAHIVEKPITSAVIAVGIGFAIGRLLK